MTMGTKFYQKIAAILFDGAQPIDVLSQHLPPNPATLLYSADYQSLRPTPPQSLSLFSAR